VSAGSEPLRTRGKGSRVITCKVCIVRYPDCQPRVSDPALACDACREALVREVVELWELAEELDLTPRAGSGPKVSGSREAPLPVRLDVLNLVGPGSANVRDIHGDQVGELPLAVWWAEWHGAWGIALDWQLALAYHEAVDDFARELATMARLVRGALGISATKPEYRYGVPCRNCDVKALWSYPDDNRVACRLCGVVYAMDEYRSWTQEVVSGITVKAA
jgi:hypothetical protein